MLHRHWHHTIVWCSFLVEIQFIVRHKVSFVIKMIIVAAPSLTVPSGLPMVLIMISPLPRQCDVWGYATPAAALTASPLTNLCTLNSAMGNINHKAALKGGDCL